MFSSSCWTTIYCFATWVGSHAAVKWTSVCSWSFSAVTLRAGENRQIASVIDQCVQPAECVHRISTIFCAALDEVRLKPIVVFFTECCSGLFLVDGESRISESRDSASRDSASLSLSRALENGSNLILLGLRIWVRSPDQCRASSQLLLLLGCVIGS